METSKKLCFDCEYCYNQEEDNEFHYVWLGSHENSIELRKCMLPTIDDPGCKTQEYVTKVSTACNKFSSKIQPVTCILCGKAPCINKTSSDLSSFKSICIECKDCRISIVSKDLEEVIDRWNMLMLATKE